MMTVMGVTFLPSFVCVCFLSMQYLKNNAARKPTITKLNTEKFKDESWKPIYVGVKRFSKVKVTSHKTFPVWVSALR